MPDITGMNEAQREAVTHGEGPMLVLAGPGSGKTFTITNRISYLIAEHKVAPENILVITFTKEAALSMQQRFWQQARLSQTSAHSKSNCRRDQSRQSSAMEAGFLPVNFGTFHAVFYQILQQSSQHTAEHLMKDSEKKKLILPIIIEYKKKQEKLFPDTYASGDNYEDAAKLLSVISYYKNTGDKNKAAALLEDSWKTGFEEIFSAYETMRGNLKRLDFDDMVYGCLTLLKKDKNLRKSWQQRFQYILIDEFQDINPIQYQVIQLLAAPPHNIFCVGDDDQSIYGFRGSDPSLMSRFLKDYPKARQVLLNYNYRSQAEIVESSLLVVSRNQNRFPKELKAARKQKNQEKEGSVRLRSFPSKDQQNQYLAQQLLARQSLKTLEQCAVLFRTNSQMQGFAALLTKAHIPFTMKEKSTCIYDHFIATDLMNYMRFASGERTRSLFLAIMNKPSRYISREALTEEMVDFVKLRDYYRKYCPPGRFPTMMERIGKLEKDLARLKNSKPYLGVQFLRKGIGYEEYLRHKAGTHKEKEKEWRDLLDWLNEDARQYESWEKWKDYQEIFREELERSTTNREEGEKGVRLMTTHASKGLEFDCVYVPDVNEGVYPYGRMPDKDTVEEERRMLYVAMTRAKNTLELLYVTGTKDQPSLPSRFLNPLL